MTDADRIRLAEAMGWNNITDKHLDADSNLYVLGGFPPHTKAYGVTTVLPDPDTDANDCEALIRWLNEQGFAVIRGQYADGLGHVHLLGHGVELRWKGKNEDNKKGVCELALKVIESAGGP